MFLINVEGSSFGVNVARKKEATQFCVEDDIRELNLYDKALDHFSNIRWAFFFKRTWDTYWGLTLEMLTTLNLDSNQHDGPQDAAFLSWWNGVQFCQH